MLSIGMTGEAVAELQRKIGVTADGIFGSKTKAKVIEIQKAHGLTPDGVVGPKTAAAIAGGAVPQPSVPPTHQGTASWMEWLKAREGGQESDPVFSAQMSRYWPLVGLDYTNIRGRDHAWCALTLNAALKETGYHGNGRADAVSFEKYGTACGWVYGAIIPIRHRDGSHHVTTFVKWIDESGKIAACLGGNQGDALQVSNYNLSGNANGHDECVSGPRWPV